MFADFEVAYFNPFLAKPLLIGLVKCLSLLIVHFADLSNLLNALAIEKPSGLKAKFRFELKSIRFFSIA